jgi:excisionase family DNA binding protein
MLQPVNLITVFTPEQVAEMLQVSKNTVYDLINRGEIVAKKIGKLYRISASSLSFFYTGLDYDLYEADQVDRKEILKIQSELTKIRSDIP